ncbi:MAG: hypothetical protein EYR95_18140 [Phormidium sp. SL48-SHIP]|nr:MAG: hypothetical protein EYR95_18140 [Phormidium sp. SL48-SHIP]
MSDDITVEVFRESAPAGLRWLVERGFSRARDLEKETPTMGTLVYRGKNVAFEFSFDARDQCIDAEVIKVERGSLRRNWDGGYSKDIYTHLVAAEGYRGSPMGSLSVHEFESKLDKAIAGWSSLLETAGSKLLSDSSESLG